MRNRCFSTYIRSWIAKVLNIMISTNYKLIFSLLFYNHNFLIYNTISFINTLYVIITQQNLPNLEQQNSIAKFLTMNLSQNNKCVATPSYGQNRSIILKPFLKQSLYHKPIEQQYQEIYKKLSKNYFQKSAVGDFMNKTIGKKNHFSRILSARQTIGICSKPMSLGNFQFDELLDTNTQINRLMKVANAFSDVQDQKQKNNSTSKKQNNFAGIRNDVKHKTLNNNFLLTSKTLNNKENKQCKQKKGIQKKKISRPRTCRQLISNVCIPSKKKKLTNDYFKFIQIDQKKITNEIRSLKKSVGDLQNIAINDYGIQFDRCQKQQQLDSEYNVKNAYEQFQNKLKQVRPFQVQQQREKQSQDCSIPFDLIRRLKIPQKKRMQTSTSMSGFKKMSNFYLRI